MHLEKQMNHAYVVPYIFFQKVINSKDKINSTIQRFKINIFTSRFQVFCSDFKRKRGRYCKIVSQPHSCGYVSKIISISFILSLLHIFTCTIEISLNIPSHKKFVLILCYSHYLSPSYLPSNSYNVFLLLIHSIQERNDNSVCRKSLRLDTITVPVLFSPVCF